MSGVTAAPAPPTSGTTATSGNDGNDANDGNYGVNPVRPAYRLAMSESLDLTAFTERFRERAKAVRNRPMPPVEGPERQRFKDRMQLDFQDFAMVGDATAELVDGILTLTIDLRP